MVSGLDTVAPIERQSVAEQVAKKLMELVRTGSLKPGDQLPPERELAQILQVSRPSVREALRGLQILGVVKMRQGGGVYVTALEASDLLAPLQFLLELNAPTVDALHEARILVEGTIAGLAAQRIDAAALARLHGLLAVQRSVLRDPVGFRVSDMEFHRVIYAASGNPFLERVGGSFFVLGMEYRRIASETPGVLERSFADHEAILAALDARDAVKAGEAMRRHMTSVYETTLAAMEKAR